MVINKLIWMKINLCIARACIRKNWKLYFFAVFYFDEIFYQYKILISHGVTDILFLIWHRTGFNASSFSLKRNYSCKKKTSFSILRKPRQQLDRCQYFIHYLIDSKIYLKQTTPHGMPLLFIFPPFSRNTPLLIPGGDLPIITSRERIKMLGFHHRIYD